MAKHPFHATDGIKRFTTPASVKFRGLWERNGRYYAQLTVKDPNTRAKAVRRIPLERPRVARLPKEKGLWDRQKVQPRIKPNSNIKDAK